MTDKLNVLVAERVMRGVLVKHEETYRWPNNHSFCPSTSIADAFQVVEKIKTRLHETEEIEISLSIFNGEWSVSVGLADSVSDTAPLAICIAALKAVGVSEEEIEEALK